MWRLVFSVWLVSVVVFLPARIVVWAAVGRTFAALPIGDLPDGELVLITTELLRPVLAPLALAAISGLLTLWGWTVLWHAGVVRWLVTSGPIKMHLTEVLGHGLVGWWRWARLGLTSLGVLVMLHSALLMAIRKIETHTRDYGNDGLLGVGVPVALAISVLALVLCWLATLRGAWLLGVGERRSAVLAWVAGLWGSVRHPLSSISTLAFWALPGAASIVLPVMTSWKFEALRGVVPIAVFEAVAGLLTAVCLVGLFLSFAPVTGLVGGKAGRPMAD